MNLRDMNPELRDKRGRKTMGVAKEKEIRRIEKEEKEAGGLESANF